MSSDHHPLPSAATEDGDGMTVTPEIRCALDDLVASYALAVDDRDFVGVAELFTPDGEFHLPDPPDRLDPVRSLRGRAEITAAMLRLEAMERTVHTLGGQVYRPGPDPGTLIGAAAGTANHLITSGDSPMNLAWHLRYRDTYRRLDGTWLFAQRAVHVRWIETHQVRWNAK